MSAVTSGQSKHQHDLVAARDRDLLRLCLANAPGAWDSFLARYSGLVSFVVDRTAIQRGMSLPDVDRDDIVADVMVEFVRNDAAALRAFAGKASLPTYLTVIARRVAVRSLRRTATANRRHPAAAVAERVADHRDQAAAAANREEIETLLERLDPQSATLVRLHHLEGRSYGDISRMTGLPLGSIGPALSLARQQMRHGLGPMTTDGSARSTGS